MMQKKDYDSHQSAWQDNLNKEKRKNLIQKLVIWGTVALITVAGVALLIKMSGGTTPQATEVVINLPKVTDSDIIVGEKSAKVNLIEYSDFQCPACAAYNSVVNEVLSNYKGKVNLVYRFFPLTGIHKNAIISGQAAYAAWKLGKFSQMKDELFNNQSKWEGLSEEDAKKAFIEFAKGIKLDENEFAKIMNSDEAKAAVLADEKSSLSLGLKGTPSFFIGNKQIKPSGYDGFKKVIDSELGNQEPLR